MSKLLYITANPKNDLKLSKGMQIGEVFLEEFKAAQPDVEIERWHLYDMDIPEIDMDLLYARAKLSFMGYTKEQLSEAERSKLEKMHELADRFIAADYYVFVTPIWNLGAPSILKKFIDNLFIVEKTFTNTPDGPRGLLTGRKAIHIQTREASILQVQWLISNLVTAMCARYSIFLDLRVWTLLWRKEWIIFQNRFQKLWQKQKNRRLQLLELWLQKRLFQMI